MAGERSKGRTRLSDAPCPDAVALLAARCPELALELPAPESWPRRWSEQARNPDDVLLIAAWALDAPDAQARRLRLEHRAWRAAPVDLVRRPRFRPSWLLDPIAWVERLGAAKRWAELGRPLAVDALGPAPEPPGVHDELVRWATLADGRLSQARGRAGRERLLDELRLLRDAGAEPAPITPAAPVKTEDEERAELEATAVVAIEQARTHAPGTSIGDCARAVLRALGRDLSADNVLRPEVSGWGGTGG